MKEPQVKAVKNSDKELLPYIRDITDRRSSYGYRRVTTLLNKQLIKDGKPHVNHKRVYRIMKVNSLLLPASGQLRLNLTP